MKNRNMVRCKRKYVDLKGHFYGVKIIWSLVDADWDHWQRTLTIKVRY